MERKKGFEARKETRRREENLHFFPLLSCLSLCLLHASDFALLLIPSAFFPSVFHSTSSDQKGKAMKETYLKVGMEETKGSKRATN